MGRRASTTPGEPEDDMPEIEEIPVTTEPESKPIEIVDIEEANQAVAAPELVASGKRFFFGHTGVLKFSDDTKHHIKKNHELITDQKLIENLLEEAKKPNAKIFPED